MAKKYSEIWTAQVQITAKEGFVFNDLIDLDEDQSNQIYLGAFANVIVKAKTKKMALEIIPLGMAEKNSIANEITGLKNLQPLVDKKQINIDYITESDWLLESPFIFKIVEKLWPCASK